MIPFNDYLSFCEPKYNFVCSAQVRFICHWWYDDDDDDDDDDNDDDDNDNGDDDNDDDDDDGR